MLSNKPAKSFIIVFNNIIIVRVMIKIIQVIYIYINLILMGVETFQVLKFLEKLLYQISKLSFGIFNLKVTTIGSKFTTIYYHLNIYRMNCKPQL